MSRHVVYIRSTKRYTLKVELLELKSSQEFVCSKYESLKSEYEKLHQTNRKQESEIISLKEQSTAFENKQIKNTEKLDAVEQYSRRQNLEIKGVPIVYGKDTNKIVVEVARSLNVDISTDDISTSHRLFVSKKREKTITQPPLQSLLGLLTAMFATKFMQTGNLPVNWI